VQRRPGGRGDHASPRGPTVDAILASCRGADHGHAPLPSGMAMTGPLADSRANRCRRASRRRPAPPRGPGSTRSSPARASVRRRSRGSSSRRAPAASRAARRRRGTPSTTRSAARGSPRRWRTARAAASATPSRS
jgi:hypothetical protein